MLVILEIDNLIRQLSFALEDSIVEIREIVTRVRYTVVSRDRNSEISFALVSLFIVSSKLIREEANA